MPIQVHTSQEIYQTAEQKYDTILTEDQRYFPGKYLLSMARKWQNNTSNLSVMEQMPWVAHQRYNYVYGCGL